MTRILEFISDVHHAEYPILPISKVAAVRLLGARLRAYAERERIVEPKATALFADLHTRASALNPGRDSEPLENYLLRIAKSLKSDHKGRIEKHLLTHFIDEISEIGCSSCPGRSKHASGKPCRNDRPHDRAVMTGGPQCWSLLTDLFTALVELAHREYMPWLGIGTLALRLKTMHTSGEDIGARTRFPTHDDLGDRNATVEINLPVDWFDEAHMKRLPYLMFHEICVHGPEAWHGASRSRAGPQRTSERCSFREGFVDAAATHTLVSWLQTQPSALKRWRELALQCMLPTETAQLSRAITSLGLMRAERAGVIPVVITADSDVIPSSAEV